jgi:Domain of unknown function (DUF4159)
MTHQSFPTPPIDPFELLHIYDGLMMNRKRWLLAHDYHRRRQNVHYQSLNQPGIVCGLGVRLIDPPTEVSAQFRDRRWLEIQPGIAIDVEGNPIVVDDAIDRKYRIRTETPVTGTLTVYLVVSYVEPDNPERQQNTEVLREWFRFDERTHPPSAKEIELCRIKLQPGTVKLENPTDVLFPEFNQLDLRYRIQAQARPQAVVKVAQMKQKETDDWYNTARQNLSDRYRENLSFLIQSVAALYPQLQAETEIGQVSLQTPKSVAPYDLLYLADWQIVELDEAEIYTLKTYLKTGGIILMDSPTNNESLVDRIDEIVTQELETDLQSWQELSRNHPLRTQPFLFASLPNINQSPIQLWQGGGIILVTGDLSNAWGLDDELSLNRNDIRTAQELGINFLHFALRRRQMVQLLQ